jgi:vacuolar-type H+-ATPase subunit E/Vma4
MTFDNIKKSVLDAASAEADHILKKAQNGAEDRIAAARRAGEAEEERRYQAALRNIDEEFARRLIQRRGVTNKELLARKNICLRHVFDVARDQILALPSGQYADIMRRLLERATAGSGGLIRVHPDDRACFRQLAAELNGKRPSDQQLGLDESRLLDERGGFAFAGRGFEVDQTLATLLADIEREMAPEIAGELFG